MKKYKQLTTAEPVSLPGWLFNIKWSPPEAYTCRSTEQTQRIVSVFIHLHAFVSMVKEEATMN